MRRIASIFGNAGNVRHAVHVPIEQILLIGGGEMAVVRNALVIVVRDQVENILLQIRARADDGVDFVLTDHRRERDAEFGGGHRARQRHEHLAAGLEVGLIALGRIDQRRGVKMPVMLRDKPGNRPLGPGQGRVDVFGAAWGVAEGFLSAGNGVATIKAQRRGKATKNPLNEGSF